MKFIYISVLAAVVAACATNPNITYRAEMGWNSILTIYQQRQAECFTNGDWINGDFLEDECPISTNEATRANQIVKSYKLYADTFVASDDKKVNACQMVRLAFELGNIVNDNINPKDVDAFCGVAVTPENMALALEEAVSL